MDITPVVVIIFASTFIYFIVLGCIEIVVYIRLKLHARQVTGQVTSAYITSTMRSLYYYGEAGFTYQVGGVTYRKNQTVTKKIAKSLLPLPSRKARLRGVTKEVTVLFLPQNPSIARLLMAPRDHEKMYNFIIALGFLLFVVLATFFWLFKHQ
ncbi:MAG TPA: DUF3592 domain-containing protein [Ktedonobacteraceae bacterium]|jgi:hypothetical protein